MQNKFSSYKTVIHQISNLTSCSDLDFSKTKEEAYAKIWIFFLKECKKPLYFFLKKYLDSAKIYVLLNLSYNGSPLFVLWSPLIAREMKATSPMVS